MNENILKNLLYTKVITNDNGAEVRIPMTEEEIIQYDENVAESRRKASLPEYKFATCIGKPDGTVESVCVKMEFFSASLRLFPKQ